MVKVLLEMLVTLLCNEGKVLFGACKIVATGKKVVFGVCKIVASISKIRIDTFSTT